MHDLLSLPHSLTVLMHPSSSIQCGVEVPDVKTCGFTKEEAFKVFEACLAHVKGAASASTGQAAAARPKGGKGGRGKGKAVTSAAVHWPGLEPDAKVQSPCDLFKGMKVFLALPSPADGEVPLSVALASLTGSSPKVSACLCLCVCICDADHWLSFN